MTEAEYDHLILTTARAAKRGERGARDHLIYVVESTEGVTGGERSAAPARSPEEIAVICEAITLWSIVIQIQEIARANARAGRDMDDLRPLLVERAAQRELLLAVAEVLL